jgi:hypothetical protein
LLDGDKQRGRGFLIRLKNIPVDFNWPRRSTALMLCRLSLWAVAFLLMGSSLFATYRHPLKMNCAAIGVSNLGNVLEISWTVCTSEGHVSATLDPKRVNFYIVEYYNSPLVTERKMGMDYVMIPHPGRAISIVFPVVLWLATIITVLLTDFVALKYRNRSKTLPQKLKR